MRVNTRRISVSGIGGYTFGNCERKGCQRKQHHYREERRAVSHPNSAAGLTFMTRQHS